MPKKLTQEQVQKIEDIFFKCFNIEEMVRQKLVPQTAQTISKILNNESERYKEYLLAKNILIENAIKEYVNGKTAFEVSKKYRIHIKPELLKRGIPIKTNKQYRKQFSVNKNYFETIDSEEKAYWLGFIYADGYISENILGIAISTVDLIHLVRFKECIQYTGNINSYITNNGYSNNTQYSRITIREDKLVYDIYDKGVVYNKTKIIKFPTEDKLPKHLINHFLRGYIDGDGCITHSNKKNGCFAFSLKIMGTPVFLKKINDILKPQKEKKIYFRKENDNVGCLEFGGNKQVLNILEYIYKDSTIHLQRKYEKFLLLKQLKHGRLLSKDSGLLANSLLEPPKDLTPVLTGTKVEKN